MVILLYEFTCINLHDKLFYPLRNSKRFNVRSIQFISDFVDRFNVAHCYNWHAIYTSHASHGCHCAIVIAWMDVYCQFLAARSVGHCHWMGQLIRAHATVLSPDSNRSNWLQSLGLITRSNDWLSTMDGIARF